MLFRRKSTNLYYNVTNVDLIPLFVGNEDYDLVEENKEETPVKEEKPKTKKVKK